VHVDGDVVNGMAAFQPANQCNKVWQHIQDYIDGRLNEKMDTLYQKLDKKQADMPPYH